MENSGSEPNPFMVEVLTNAAVLAMERVSVKDVTTPADILSASFTLLVRTLQSAKKLQSAEDATANTREIARALNELLVTYGSLSN